MPRGKGKFRSWEARTRVFLVLMGENSGRDGKREWHQKSVCRELKEGGHNTSATSVYRYLKKLEEIGLATSREVEPERGIKKKKIYSPNLDLSNGGVLEPRDKDVLETFFEKFGNDFKKKGVEGLDYTLVKTIPDPIVLYIVIGEVIFSPLVAAKLCAVERREFEEFISSGSLNSTLKSYQNLGFQSYQIGTGQHRNYVKMYYKKLPEKDVEFLNNNQKLIASLLSEWMQRLSKVSVLFFQ